MDGSLLSTCSGIGLSWDEDDVDRMFPRRTKSLLRLEAESGW